MSKKKLATTAKEAIKDIVDSPTPIKLIYIGDRYTEAGMRSVFLEEGGDKENELYFKAGKFFIGSKYKGEKRSDGGMSLYPKGYIKDDAVEDEELIEEWRLKHYAAKAERSKMQSKARVNDLQVPGHIIKELQRIVKPLKSDRDKINFLDYLVDELIFKPMSEQMTLRFNRAMNNMNKKATKKKK